MAQLALGIGIRPPSCDPIVEAGLVNELWASRDQLTAEQQAYDSIVSWRLTLIDPEHWQGQ